MSIEDHGFATVLEKLGKHPSALVLAALENGPLRMSEIVAMYASVGEDTLGAALRDHDAAGLVARRVDPGPPLRVLYALTERGAKLAPALGILTRWLADG